MFLVYEIVRADFVETQINEEDMRLFATWNEAVSYAESMRLDIMKKEGAVDFFNEFIGWDKEHPYCTLYYNTRKNVAGEPSDWVEIRIISLTADKK